MANLLSQNPIIITAAMSSSYKASVAATLGTLFTLRVEKLYWENAVTKGDRVRIIDPQSGNELASFYNVANGSDYVADYTPNPRIWADFMVNQIDSGTIKLYTRAG